MAEIENMQEVLETASGRPATMFEPGRATASAKDVTGTLNTVQRFLDNIPDHMSVRDVLEELQEYREHLMRGDN